MIKEKEVKCVMKRLYCDKCGTEMRVQGFVFASYPPQYPYECPQCGYQETAFVSYSRIDYVEVGEDNQ